MTHPLFVAIFVLCVIGFLGWNLIKAQGQRDRWRYRAEVRGLALRRCESMFLRYVDIHKAKNPPDEDKIKRNQGMVDLCHDALTDGGM